MTADPDLNASTFLKWFSSGNTLFYIIDVLAGRLAAVESGIFPYVLLSVIKFHTRLYGACGFCRAIKTI